MTVHAARAVGATAPFAGLHTGMNIGFGSWNNTLYSGVDCTEYDGVTRALTVDEKQSIRNTNNNRLQLLSSLSISESVVCLRRALLHSVQVLGTDGL